jgi:hypothetical protein
VLAGGVELPGNVELDGSAQRVGVGQHRRRHTQRASRWCVEVTVDLAGNTELADSAQRGPGRGGMGGCGAGDAESGCSIRTVGLERFRFNLCCIV